MASPPLATLPASASLYRGGIQTWVGPARPHGESVPDLTLLMTIDGIDGKDGPSSKEDKQGWVNAGLKEGDWFAQHVEWSNPRWAPLGQPAPRIMSMPRQSTQNFTGKEEQYKLRAERERQLDLMAEKFRSEMQSEIRPPFDRRMIQSTPDLRGMERKQQNEETRLTAVREGQTKPEETAQSKNACCSCCGNLFGLPGLLQKRSGEEVISGTPAFNSPHSATIIFDWDDTLFPTNFLMSEVMPQLPESQRGGALPKNARLKDGTTLSELFENHGKVISFVLKAARKVARVAIVTNSHSPWVVMSANLYIPNLEVEKLLKELDIPVYYARRHVQNISVTMTEVLNAVEIDRTTGGRIGVDIIPESGGSLVVARIDETGLIGQWNQAHSDQKIVPGDKIVEVNGSREDLAAACRRKEFLKITTMRQVPDPEPYTEAKRMDMVTCLAEFYGKGKGNWRKNVISVGDSYQEQEAIKQVLKSAHAALPDADARRREPPLCKTVHLLEHPTLQQLSMELRLFAVWLEKMVNVDRDFDYELTQMDGIEKDIIDKQRPSSPPGQRKAVAKQ